jgi:hypothetical protein
VWESGKKEFPGVLLEKVSKKCINMKTLILASKPGQFLKIFHCEVVFFGIDSFPADFLKVIVKKFFFKVGMQFRLLFLEVL